MEALLTQSRRPPPSKALGRPGSTNDVSPRQAGFDADHAIKDWDDLRLILAIGRLGSFQGAAGALDTDQTTVSRRYRRLESRLGAKLFERQGQRMVATEAGELVIDRAEAMERLAKEVGRSLDAIDARPRGRVRIAVTEGVGHLWLIPRLAAFSALHPDIDYELIPSHGEYDLILNEVDIAIGYTRPEQTRLVGRRVGTVQFGVYAAQAYIDRCPEPIDPDNLVNHDLIEYAQHFAIPSLSEWMRAAREGNRVKFRSSSAPMTVAATQNGFGIGLCPLFYEPERQGLVRISNEEAIEAEIWLVSHEENTGIRRVRLLLDFLATEFGADQGRWFNRR